MNNLTVMLDKYINILRKQFPNFEYTNVIEDNFSEKKLLQDEFAIIIRGVRGESIKELRKFIRDEIYTLCLDKDDLLPNIILLQNYTSNYQNWRSEIKNNHSIIFDPIIEAVPLSIFLKIDDYVKRNIKVERSAEDYNYTMAA